MLDVPVVPDVALEPDVVVVPDVAVEPVPVVVPVPLVVPVPVAVVPVPLVPAPVVVVVGATGAGGAASRACLTAWPRLRPSTVIAVCSLSNATPWLFEALSAAMNWP